MFKLCKLDDDIVDILNDENNIKTFGIDSLKQLKELKEYNQIFSINFKKTFNRKIKENILPKLLIIVKYL